MTGYILAIVILLLCSMLFSASETAFSCINRIKIKNLAATNQRAALVLRLSSRYDRLLTTILIGNNIANIVLSTVAAMLALRIFGGRLGPTISTVFCTVIVLIFGEISPKIIAKEHPDKVAMTIVPIINALVIILTPVTLLFSGLKSLLMRIFGSKEETLYSEDELLTIVEEAEAGGAIGEEQSELIANAIEFNDARAIDVLTPRVDIIAFERGTSPARIKAIFRESGLSRLPVYEDDLDNIVGVLNQKDFYNNNVKAAKDVNELIKPVAYVGESLKASVLLRKMQNMKTHIAIVIDEYGGTSGLVTLEDIIEELVGKIYDEHDSAPDREIIRSGKNLFTVSGSTSIRDFFDEIGEEIEIQATTVNGWALIELDRLPSPGDTFTYETDNQILHVKVINTDGPRAKTLRIRTENLSESEN